MSGAGEDAGMIAAIVWWGVLLYLGLGMIGGFRWPR